jgi:hypothetical protein
VIGARVCGWCGGPIDARARRDAKYCKTPCRQAAHRFQKGAVAHVAGIRPLRLGYADPPYPSKDFYYRDHPDYAGPVDHRQLVDRLAGEFPDGWALSTSAAALRDVLALCPAGVAVAAWVKGERPTKSYRPLSSWEPVIVHAGRRYLSPVDERRVDSLVYHARPRLTDTRWVIGAKPAEFAYWMFDLLGALPGDSVVDLFPGSGGIARAWACVEAKASRLTGGERLVEPGGGDTSRGDGDDSSYLARAERSVQLIEGRPSPCLLTEVSLCP